MGRPRLGRVAEGAARLRRGAAGGRAAQDRPSPRIGLDQAEQQLAQRALARAVVAVVGLRLGGGAVWGVGVHLFGFDWRRDWARRG